DQALPEHVLHRLAEPEIDPERERGHDLGQADTARGHGSIFHRFGQSDSGKRGGPLEGARFRSKNGANSPCARGRGSVGSAPMNPTTFSESPQNPGPLEQLKRNARAAWAAGDYPAVARRQLWPVGERIV